MNDQELSLAPELPTAEDVVQWPHVFHQKALESQRTKLEKEIAGLEKQLVALQSRLEGAARPEISGNGPNNSEQKKLENLAGQREQKSKDKIVELLSRVDLADGRAETAHYTNYIDHDLAGGYDENHTVLIARKAGVYLVSHQVEFANSVGVQRGYLNPYGRKIVLHEDLNQPLTLEGKGKFNNLGQLTLMATKPGRWTSVEHETDEAVQAIRAKQFVDSVLSLLAAEELQPKIYANGYVDNRTQVARRSVTLDDGLKIELAAGFSDWGSGQLEADTVQWQLVRDEEVLERYVVDIRSLEVRPHAYGSYDGMGNKHLHDKAAALLNLAVTSLGKTNPAS